MAIYNCPQCGAILPYSGAACSSCARKRADEQRWRNQSSNLSSYVSNGSSSTSNRSSSHSSSRSYAKEIDRLSEVVTKFDKLLSFTGYKKQSFSDGSYYEGDFVNGKFHGKGKYTWANGTYYEGDFANGDFNGYGKRTYDDGAVYEGEFENDMCHGKGKLTDAAGNVYVGDWVEDCRHGKGTVRWKDGNVYVGDWVKDARTGKGKYTYADGETYEGEHKEGKRHGRGKCVLPDGTVQDGYFENGEFVGVAESAYEVDEEMDVSPEVLEQFKQNEAVPTPQPAAKDTNEEIWDKLVNLSVAERNDFLASHPEITVPSGVETIPHSMFNNCLNLKSIRFNQDLREIGPWAFMGCKNLGPTLVIPSGVKKVCKSAFSNCYSVKKIILPNNIHIEEYGFMCGVTEVEFETDPPKGVVLDKGAFCLCSMLMSKDMKKKIKDLNPKAFK